MTTLMPPEPFTGFSLFKQSWKLTFSNSFWTFLGCYVVVSGIPVVLGIIGGASCGIMHITKCPSILQISVLSLTILAVILAILLLMPGWLYVAIKVADRDNFSFADIFKTAPVLRNTIGTLILTGIIVLAGFICLVIPGIYLGLRLLLATFFAVDKQLGPVESIKASWKATDGILWTLFFFNVLFAALTIICCHIPVVGTILELPVTMACYAGTARIYRLRAENEAT